MSITDALNECQSYFEDFQNQFCARLQQLDSSKAAVFHVDDWRSKLGRGSTRVLTGDSLEKAGVNFSLVSGEHLPAAASNNRPDLAGRSFVAMGVSVVIHPRNPQAPTSHANVRVFAVEPESARPVWWFGGGFDLTPYYPYLEDCRLWHEHARRACAVLDPDLYPRFKRQCDEYFYLPHRGETRGIGGIFYDDLNEWPFADCLAFTQAVAQNYADAYCDILARRLRQNYDAAMREYQLHRRGRYVEFNLLYDRGTLFGLQSGGRTEAILVSLPAQVKWSYDWPLPQREQQLVRDYFRPRAWLEETAPSADQGNSD